MIYFKYNSSKRWDYEPLLILDFDFSLKPKNWVLSNKISRINEKEKKEKFFYVEGQTAISGIFENYSIYDFKVSDYHPFLKQVVIYYIIEYKRDRDKNAND